MASYSLLGIALMLLFTIHFSVELSIASNHDCCISYAKTSVPCYRLKGYTIQTNKDSCNIDAIIFHTIKNIRICANPSDKWVISRISCLKEKAMKLT
ncbi:C-C motif chemokine 20-like [Erpetoichthys calabaricus]|uniref:C-C motif chemokine 20-like n=1 Tax=Erpetoichthys calabaricus TaxID=27687 RepID=UPI00109F1FB4|nr:C-C motif chemokine 20-like [Erpetoichthys calabaricus]